MSIISKNSVSLFFQCSIASVRDNNKCSQCDSAVDENNTTYKEYIKVLNFLFPNEEDIDEDDCDTSEMEITESCVEGEIKVTTLSGESAVIVYQPRKKILKIKSEVEEKFKIAPNKQRLLYQDKELKVFIHLYGESIYTRDLLFKRCNYTLGYQF